MVDVSTTIQSLSLQEAIGPLDRLRYFLYSACDAPHLLSPAQLKSRLELLDELDRLAGDFDPAWLETYPNLDLIRRAKSLRSRFEAANEELFEGARSEIALQGGSPAILRWQIGSEINPNGVIPGLGFDLLDEIVSGVLQLRAPREVRLPTSTEMAAYQPTPARHILDLVATCRLSDDDLLVDLGSGLGHVPFLVSILTGASALGVELQPAYVVSARQCARSLNLRRARFVAEDARVTDLSDGTVFYLFSPFSGSILRDVVCQLWRQSRSRQFRICSLGPCTRVLQEQGWLEPTHPPNTERIAVFTSR